MIELESPSDDLFSRPFFRRGMGACPSRDRGGPPLQSLRGGIGGTLPPLLSGTGYLPPSRLSSWVRSAAWSDHCWTNFRSRDFSATSTFSRKVFHVHESSPFSVLSTLMGSQPVEGISPVRRSKQIFGRVHFSNPGRRSTGPKQDRRS